MNDPRTAHFMRQALLGRWSRRQILTRGLGLGVATPLLTALLAATPEASAAPTVATRRTLQRQQEGGGTFTLLLIGGAADIDPHSSYTTLGSIIGLGVYEMLLQYRGDSTSEFEPMLADAWEASPDNSTFTFTLAPGAVFHDGAVCDANAVKSSFVRFRRMDAGPVLVFSRFCDNPEEQIEVVDATTIRFNLGQPQPLFLAAMASSYGPYVVSPQAVEENKTDDDPWAHEWFLSNAVGTGPYRLVENTINERVVLERFDEYHRGWDGNHFDQIVMRVVEENGTRRQLIEQGEADATTYNLTPEDVEALQGDSNLHVLTYDSTRVNWAIMNAVRLSKEARQGFSYAFPYDDVLNGVYKGLVKRSGPIPDTVRGFDPNVFLYQTDLARAKELILSAGFEEGTTFDYVYSAGDEIERTIVQLFQANVQAMGFDLDVSEVDQATQDDIIFGDAPAEEKPIFMGAWAWWPDYNDPWNQLAPNFLESASGGGGSNGGYWVNPRFEEIMAEAEHFVDDARLTELMIEAQNILTEQDPPVIYHGQSVYYTVLRSNIQGFVANPLYLDAYPFYKMSRA